MLAKPIQEALVKKGLLQPTEPQEKAIPFILKGENVLLIAPTGTGKTEAAVLPIFHNLITNPQVREERGIKILYITPLRALNRDLLERLEWWGRELDIKVAVRHGDTEQSERQRQARAPPDMLITTPETLQAIMTGRVMRSHLMKTRWVVVDEVHELAEDKRGSQLTLALERLRYISGRDFQIVGLSATIGSPEEVARFLVGVNRPVRIVRVPVARLMRLKVVFPEPTSEDYELSAKLYTHPEVVARLRYMRELIEKHNSVLLFVNTRAIAEVLASRFHVWDLKFPISVHHGSLAKPSRIAAERGLKEGALKGLICTSSLELGIDVGRVDLVIQYMSPRQVTRLIQRVGRSGHRIGGIAKGVIITADPDDTLEALVICRRALREELEPIKIPYKPLDVLNHQIVALLMIKNRLTFDDILSIYKRAYPYKDLTKEDLLFVLRYMHTRYPRLAWISEDDEVVLRPRNRRDFYLYFFEELSMIPDEKHYLVIDSSTNTPIGLLDETFVAEYGDIGTKFVFRGSVWIIREISGDRVYVTPVSDPTGAIPSWVGEEIPVPYEIAQEVGQIKSRVEEYLKNGLSIDDIASLLSKEYPADKGTIVRALREISEQVRLKYPVPTDKRVLIETWGNLVIIHVHLGTLANRALGRLMAEYLAKVIGASVGVQQDPYHIVLQLPVKIRAIDVLESMRSLAKEDLSSYVKSIAARSGLFKRRLIHVARRFGALEKSVDFSEVSLRRLVEAFEGTPIFEEALKEFLSRDIDLDKAEEFLRKIARGDIEVVCLDSSTPSPMTRYALERISRKTELIPPERMKMIILEATKARLLNEARVFICTNCWNWYEVRRIMDLPSKIACPSCGSSKVGVLNVDENSAKRIISLKGRPRSRADERLVKDALATARLIERYGKVAAIVLAGRGLTHRDAEEILSKAHEFNDKLIHMIIDAERKALRRRFI